MFIIKTTLSLVLIAAASFPHSILGSDDGIAVAKVANEEFDNTSSRLLQTAASCCPGVAATCPNGAAAMCCPDGTWTCPTMVNNVERYMCAGTTFVGGPPDGVSCLAAPWRYTRPVWWPDIVMDNTGPNLRRCYQRQFPPTTGDSCSWQDKTCYFGDQVCPSGKPYPSAKCSCSGGSVNAGVRSYGTWTCDHLLCPSCSVSGNLSYDADGNGTGDFPLQGSVIMLLDSSGNMRASVLTDSNGNYDFPNLPPGDYSIKQTNLPGFASVSDTDFNNDPDLIEIEVGGGSPCTSVANDFVDEDEPLLCTISGSVTEDTNNDGDGDSPLKDALITLVDSNTGTIVTTAMTGVNGQFFFGNLQVGHYTLVETDPPGYISVRDSDGSVNNSNNIDNNNNEIEVTIGGTEPCDGTGHDFVDKLPP